MIEIKRILCPVDFSEFSQRAVEHAVAIAGWYDATVTLLHVRALVPIAPAVPEMLPPMTLTPDDREELRAALSRFVPDGTAVPFERDVVEGHAASEIVAHANAMRSDLVVLGTRGRTGFERLLLGSVTERVLRKAPCPVLSVPGPADGATPVAPVFKRILCAVDFSDCSMRARDLAGAVNRRAPHGAPRLRSRGRHVGALARSADAAVPAQGTRDAGRRTARTSGARAAGRRRDFLRHRDSDDRRNAVSRDPAPGRR